MRWVNNIQEWSGCDTTELKAASMKRRAEVERYQRFKRDRPTCGRTFVAPSPSGRTVLYCCSGLWWLNNTIKNKKILTILIINYDNNIDHLCSGSLLFQLNRRLHRRAPLPVPQPLHFNGRFKWHLSLPTSSKLLAETSWNSPSTKRVK